MTHSHSTAYELGVRGAQKLSDAYNSEAAQGFGGLVTNVFNKVTGALSNGVDLGTGFFSEYIGEDWGKVAATVLTLGTASYLANGQSPLYQLGLFGVAAGALYHSSDNIHPDSTVGSAINYLTEDFVEFYQTQSPHIGLG